MICRFVYIYIRVGIIVVTRNGEWVTSLSGKSLGKTRISVALSLSRADIKHYSQVATPFHHLSLYDYEPQAKIGASGRPRRTSHQTI